MLRILLCIYIWLLTVSTILAFSFEQAHNNYYYLLYFDNFQKNFHFFFHSFNNFVTFSYSKKKTFYILFDLNAWRFYSLPVLQSLFGWSLQLNNVKESDFRHGGAYIAKTEKLEGLYLIIQDGMNAVSKIQSERFEELMQSAEV